MRVKCAPSGVSRASVMLHQSVRVLVVFSASPVGAGSCLETLEKGKPLLVVINEKLMDNHQLELAKQLHRDGHVLYCNCRYGAIAAVRIEHAVLNTITLLLQY